MKNFSFFSISKTLSFLLLGGVFLSFASNIFQKSKKTNQVTPIDKQQLIKLTERNSDSLFVINFWATWCRPCVKELPYFNAAHKKYKNIAMSLVSMDFEEDLEKRVVPFFERKNFSDYEMDKYLVTSMDYDNWMSEIDKDWSGSIPATLFYNKTKNIYYFHEGDYTEKELYHTIDSLQAL